MSFARFSHRCPSISRALNQCVPLLTGCTNMEGEGDRNERLPLTHPERIKARDLKLHQRDEQRANRNELTRYRCPCNLCGGRRRPYKRATVARHLRHRGRHGALRGWTQVMYSPLTNLERQQLVYTRQFEVSSR